MDKTKHLDYKEQGLSCPKISSQIMILKGCEAAGHQCSLLHKNIFHGMAMNIRQSVPPPLVLEGEPFVINTHLIRSSAVQTGVLDYL